MLGRHLFGKDRTKIRLVEQQEIFAIDMLQLLRDARTGPGWIVLGARELDEIESPTDDSPGIQVVPKLGNDDVRTTSVPARAEAYLVDSTRRNDLLVQAVEVNLLPFDMQHLLVFVDILLQTPLAICGIERVAR